MRTKHQKGCYPWNHSRQKFNFAARGTAVVLAANARVRHDAGMAMADDSAPSNETPAWSFAAQEKTPDGYAMVEGQAYEVPVTYNANLQSYLDLTAPASVVWDGEKYTVTVKVNAYSESPPDVLSSPTAPTPENTHGTRRRGR